MKVSQALEAVSRIYVPGVAKYYAALTPDPWFSAHEELERIMIEGDPEAIAVAADRFVERTKELVERFKREGSPSKGVSAADGLFLGSERRTRAWQSRKSKSCAKCDSKENLRLIANPEDKLDVAIVCRNCAEGLERRPA